MVKPYLRFKMSRRIPRRCLHRCHRNGRPQANCPEYGNGCAMCIRCPSFGGRVSIAALAGVKETAAKKTKDRVGAMSGSCKLNKESLSEEIQQQLNEKEQPLSVPEKWKEDHLSIKACQQYNLAPFKDNIVLLDTGHRSS